MKQQLITKIQEVKPQNQTTVEALLLERMKLLGIESTPLETVAQHLVISIDGVMFKDILKKIVNVGQRVLLIPAQKGG